MEHIPTSQNENLPQGEMHNMEDDIRASMPQVELTEGEEKLMPPLPRLELFSLPDGGAPLPTHEGANKKVVLGAILGVLVLILVGGGGFYFWLTRGTSGGFISRGNNQNLVVEETPLESPTISSGALGGEVSPSPIPSDSATASPITAPLPTPSLAGIVSNIPVRVITLSTTTEDAVLEGIHGLSSIPESSVALLSFGHENTTPLLTSLGEFSESFGLKLPESLISDTTAWQMYAYNSGAREQDFCSTIKNSACAGLRLGFILKVASSSAAQTHMREFESVAKSSLTPLIIPAINPSSYSGFRDADYRGTKLRYINFPIVPQKTASSIVSLNYAVVSSGGASYLVVGTSRLSFYKMLDSIMLTAN